MADSTTANYGWTKPEPGASDDTWGSKINVDLDGIDAKVHEIDTRAVGGSYLPLAGGTLTGPLNISTTTQPEMTIGWSTDTTLMQFGVNTITLNGNGGPAPATSNKTQLGVNSVSFGHKSYNGGNQPITLSQSNQGEFYIALGAGAPFAFSDLKNGHAVATSKDAGNVITYGSDGHIFSPSVAGPQGPAGPQGSPGATGPAGPSAVSANVGNSATLGSDSLIYVPTPSIPPGTVVADTPPSSPQAGALWWDSVGGQLYVWFTDANTSQWVVANNQSVPGPVGPAGPAGAAGPSGPNTMPPGVTDGSNAAAGQIGEVISNTTTFPGTTLTSGTSATVATISLTAGDWDVYGTVWMSAGTGAPTAYQCGISATSASLPGNASINQSKVMFSGTMTASVFEVATPAPCRVNLTSTANYYLVSAMTFPSGSCSAYGSIWARRAR